MPEVRGIEQNDALCSALEELRGSRISIESSGQLLVLYQVGREGAIQRVLYCKPDSAAFEEENAIPPKSQSRYTVELTTEGWQIKKPDGSFFASAFGSKRTAEYECRQVNRIDGRIDAAEGESRK